MSQSSKWNLMNLWSGSRGRSAPVAINKQSLSHRQTHVQHRDSARDSSHGSESSEEDDSDADNDASLSSSPSSDDADSSSSSPHPLSARSYASSQTSDESDLSSDDGGSASFSSGSAASIGQLHITEDYITLDKFAGVVDEASSSAVMARSHAGLLSLLNDEKEALLHQNPHVKLTLEVVDPDSGDKVCVSREFELRLKVKKLEQEVAELQDQKLELELETQALQKGQQRQLDTQERLFRKLAREHEKVSEELSRHKVELREAYHELERVRRENKALKRKLRKAGMENLLGNEDDGKLYVCSHCLQQQQKANQNNQQAPHNMETRALFRKSQIAQSQVATAHGAATMTYSIFTSNVSFGPRVCRKFPSGLFTVLQLFCDGCLSPIGWKFEEAFEDRQAYREGKFMIFKTCFQEVDATELDVKQLVKLAPLCGNADPGQGLLQHQHEQIVC